MARRKLKIAYIHNKTQRKVYYQKKKKLLLKKVEELSILCGVEACAIIYSLFEEEPQIWPPSHLAVQNVLEKFKNLSVIEKNRNKVSHEEFLTQRINKLEDKLENLVDGNRKKEVMGFVSQFLAGEVQQQFNISDLEEMKGSIIFSVQSISRRIESLKTREVPPLMTPVAHPATNGDNLSDN